MSYQGQRNEIPGEHSSKFGTVKPKGTQHLYSFLASFTLGSGMICVSTIHIPEADLHTQILLFNVGLLFVCSSFLNY